MLHTPGDPRSAIATRSPHATPSKPTAVAGDPITVSAPPPHPSPLTARPVAFPFPDHRRTPPSPSIPSPSPSPIPANRPPLPSFSASPSALGKPRGGTLHGALGWDAMQCACWAVGVGGRRSGGGSGAGGPGARAIGPGARIAWGRGMATRDGRLVIGAARRGGVEGCSNLPWGVWATSVGLSLYMGCTLPPPQPGEVFTPDCCFGS